ncbi:TonB-dependent receptor plug domain-containing protein [Flavobacterium sp. ZT3R17]|uniref:TonB-dependent receptor plug domain-containing protein n=1 Tax=Flavobacterium cryoconiti TaxID=3398736 RepID=UPI003A855B5D
MKISKTLLFILLLFVGFGYAQNKLTGKVMNSNNKPVANAKIYLDSIYSNVETNKNGDFEVQLPEKVSVINVYSHEYGLLSSKYSNESIMNFMFLESEKSIKERTKKGDKISIGYSEVDKKYKVNNSEGISLPNDKNAITYNTIYDMIRGRLSGVTVSRDNKITIRGVSSIRNISEPLFVVDGMIVSNIDYISPNNVKNISVLKGADASIYGSQASAGVIVIKTK